ncbi:MAG: PhoH family protein [Candidatus Omnitrophica bacterium]|nr:PhoH family protein [Candidatus Omnitrophota bacterium]
MNKFIRIENAGEAQRLFGPRDEHLKLISRAFGVTLIGRGETLTIGGEKDTVERSEQFIHQLLECSRKGQVLSRTDITQALVLFQQNGTFDLGRQISEAIEVPSKRKHVVPRTRTQREYIEAIKRHDVVFGIGPAGTGKTYLAIAMAVAALVRQIVSRIILARPAVEAGEQLGFLPGTVTEKVNPYLRPLYDALYEMMEFDRVQQLLNRGIIEVAPLAFMRGRTLNDSFIILDEAQNTTSGQMLMFLTRLGFDSKAVITGDVTQVDLPRGKASGLVEAQKLLKGIEGIRFVQFGGEDVVRHRLVQEVISAYKKTRPRSKKNAREG